MTAGMFDGSCFIVNHPIAPSHTLAYAMDGALEVCASMSGWAEIGATPHLPWVNVGLNFYEKIYSITHKIWWTELANPIYQWPRRIRIWVGIVRRTQYCTNKKVGTWWVQVRMICTDHCLNWTVSQLWYSVHLFLSTLNHRNTAVHKSKRRSWRCKSVNNDAFDCQWPVQDRASFTHVAAIAVCYMPGWFCRSSY